MGKDASIYIFKIPISNVPSFCSNQFFCNPRPDHDCPGHFFFLHHFFHGDGSINNDCLSRIMPLTMTWSSIYDRRSISNSRFLRCLRNTINITSQSNYRRSRTPLGHPGCWYTRNSLLHRKAVFFQFSYNKCRCLPFLKTKFGITENLIYHHLDISGMLTNIF